MAPVQGTSSASLAARVAFSYTRRIEPASGVRHLCGARWARTARGDHAVADDDPAAGTRSGRARARYGALKSFRTHSLRTSSPATTPASPVPPVF